MLLFYSKLFQFDISVQVKVFCFSSKKCGLWLVNLATFLYNVTLWMLFCFVFFYCSKSLHLKILSKELLQYLFLTKFIHPLSSSCEGCFLCCKAFCFTMLIRYCFYDTENMHTHKHTITHILYIQYHPKFVSQSIWAFIDKTIWHLEYIN